MLGLHSSRSWLKKSDSLQHIQSYRDSEASAGQLATRNGVLIEYETLELRCNPPQITIANDSKEDVTVVTMDSANRPGTLVEVRKQSGVSAWSYQKVRAGQNEARPGSSHNQTPLRALFLHCSCMRVMAVLRSRCGTPCCRHMGVLP